MLPAEHLELITAAVDGELSATQGRAFRRLLETSTEARALYEKLKTDQERVRALARTAPKASPPADLKTKILARIAATTPKPKVKPTAQPTQPAQKAEPAKPAQPEPRESEPLPSRRVPLWVPASVAAGLLICVTAGSFAYFNGQNRTKSGSPLAKNPWSNDLPAQHDAPAAVPSPTAPAPAKNVLPDALTVAKSDALPVPPAPTPKDSTPDPLAIAPEPREVVRDLHASRILPPLPPFDFIQVRVPFLRTIAELEREDIRKELADELGRPDPMRLDLFVRDTARGVEVFQSAAKAAGVTLFSDAATLEKLKKKQVASVVIFTENMTAAELTALFAKVSAEDAKFSPRVCDSLHAASVVRSDEDTLKLILGTDIGLYKQRSLGPIGTGGAGAPRSDGKPISADTIDSVVKSVTNPAAKAGDKTAVLLTWQTTNPMTIPRTIPATSNELKAFLAKRDRKLNTVPAIIVIRLVG